MLIFWLYYGKGMELSPSLLGKIFLAVASMPNFLYDILN